MIRKFRRRFILINFGLIALVLFVVLTFVGVYMHHQYLNSLENTMRTLLQPFQIVSSQTDDGDSTSDGVVGALYRKETDHITFFLKDSAIEGVDLDEAVRQAYEQEDDFGRIKELGVYYCRMDANDDVKIALIAEGPVLRAVSNLYLLLAGIYIISLLVFFGVSILLSNLAVRPVQEAWEREKRFMADASHELKTPLTIIRANMSILRKDPALDGADAMRWVESSDETAEFMSDLVENMLSYSQAVEETPQMEMIDLSSVTARFVLQMEAVAYEKQVTLESDLPVGIEIEADLSGVNQVLQNLLGNAVKFEPSGGIVNVEIENRPNEVCLRVKNRLAHIDEADIPHLFDRFYRTEGAKSIRGHGLGLAIARRIMERMDGSLTVCNLEPTGTCFEACFPSKK